MNFWEWYLLVCGIMFLSVEIKTIQIGRMYQLEKLIKEIKPSKVLALIQTMIIMLIPLVNILIFFFMLNDELVVKEYNKKVRRLNREYMEAKEWKSCY